MYKADPLSPHKIKNNILDFIFIYLYTHSQNSGDKVQESAFFFHYVGPEDRIQFGSSDLEAGAFTH